MPEFYSGTHLHRYESELTNSNKSLEDFTSNLLNIYIDYGMTFMACNPFICWILLSHKT